LALSNVVAGAGFVLIAADVVLALVERGRRRV
jgi:hypothetical protein